MHDDLFAITGELISSVPVGATGVLAVLLVSFLLAWLKLAAEGSRQARLRRVNDDGEVRCTFPQCGKPLLECAPDSRVQSKQCELEYCSARCLKRDWRENNHASVAILLKRRRQELQQQEEGRRLEVERGWVQHLLDLIPEPQGLYRSGLDTALLSSQMEKDAFSITARTFCQAYMAKFAMAVHAWAAECYACSGRGAVVIHLSEKALLHSSGAPLSYVPRRVLARLEHGALDQMLRDYEPSTHLVVYVFQRGVHKHHLAFPFCYTVYDSETAAAAAAGDAVKGGGNEGRDTGGAEGNDEAWVKGKKRRSGALRHRRHARRPWSEDECDERGHGETGGVGGEYKEAEARDL